MTRSSPIHSTFSNVFRFAPELSPVQISARPSRWLRCAMSSFEHTVPQFEIGVDRTTRRAPAVGTRAERTAGAALGFALQGEHCLTRRRSRCGG